MRPLFFTILVILSVPSFAQEHARILEHSTSFYIHENQTADIEEHYIIKILSDPGYSMAIYEQYFDKFRKLTDVTIDIFDQNGKKIKRLKRNNGIEFGLSPSNEITDGIVLTIKPDYKEYPFTLEVSSKIKLEGFVSLPNWVPRSKFHQAVTNAELIITRPATVKLNFREEHISGVTHSSGNKIVTRYNVSNLGHIDDKIRYKDFYNEQPKVLTSPEKFKLENMPGSSASWKDFGNWFFALNNEPYELTAKTKDFINHLEKDAPKELIRNIYEYMQDNTRYVSIQLGIGGFQSLPTEDVERFGYGDCKALTTYMKNMLDYAGVKSHYVLVHAGNDVPDVIDQFPSNQFNHVFLGVPSQGDTLYLECTSQIMPINYIGSFTDDRNVLWIDFNNSSIIRSRVYHHTDNLQDNFITLKLSADGNAIAEFDIFNQGIFFDELLLLKMATTDFIRNYNLSKFNYNDFNLKKYSFNQPERESPSFNSKYSLEINGLGKVSSDKLIIPIVPISPFYKYMDKDELKKYCAIKRGLTITDEITINLPQNYWIYNVPESELLKSGFGTYQLSTSFDGKKINIKRTIVLYKGDYKNEEYEAFKSFYQAIDKLEKRKLVLNSKT